MYQDKTIKVIDTPGYVFANFAFYLPNRYSSSNLFHIGRISLEFLRISNCKINKIKGMKPHNSAKSSLDSQ